jgi:hypothetical protein
MNANAKFKKEETSVLIEVIRNVIPLGREEWELVEAEYNAALPMCNRTLENLRRKYNSLANKKCPTGDPNIPVHVQQAKEIKSMIFKKSEAQVLGRRSFEEDEDSLDGIENQHQANNVEANIATDGVEIVTPENTNKGRGIVAKFKRGKQEMSEVMEFMVMNEMAARRSDEKREKRERRKDRKDEKRNSKQMMMMMMMMASGVSKNKEKEKIMNLMDDDDSSSSSSSTSFDGDEKPKANENLSK